MMFNEHKKIFFLNKKEQETDDVLTLTFLPKDGKMMSFIPGQYVDIFIPGNSVGDLSRSYTISSVPGESFLSVTLKKRGVFSSLLFDLALGDEVLIEGPAGLFFLGESPKELVFLAGGVGIAPFYSIINEQYKRGDCNKNIDLIYSNRTKSDIVFFDELQEISSKWEKLRIVHTLTRETVTDSDIQENGRINLNLIERNIPNFREKDFYLCGSSSFVRDLRILLVESGVDKEKIYMEAFY